MVFFFLAGFDSQAILNLTGVTMKRSRPSKGKAHQSSHGEDHAVRSTVCKYHGLRNQGATCYLNSVLQVLFMTKDFREIVKRKSSPPSINQVLASLFKALEKHAAHTADITRLFSINVHEQRDAADYFEKILNRTSPEASEMFQGQLSPRTTCSKCKDHTNNEEPFWWIPLILLDSASGDYRVADGIQEFFRPSSLTGEDQIYCDQCQAKADATINVELKHHPEVLTLLLKRFTFDYCRKQFVKIYCTVDVPFRLTIEDQNYELYALVEHSGDLKKGHYTTTIKPPNDDKWYHFNDTKVTVLPYQPFQVDNSYRYKDAYLLFYRKKKRNQSEDISKVETCGLNGSAVKAEESEETASAAGVESVTGNNDGSVTDDGGREKPELTKDHADRKEKEETGEPPASADGDRSGTVGELRAQSPTDVKVENASREAGAGKKLVEQANKAFQAVSRFCRKKTSRTKHEDPIEMKNFQQHNRLDEDKETQIQDGCDKAESVQATDGHSDQTDERSGQNSLCGERAETDQHQTESTRYNEDKKKEEKEGDVQRGDDENHLESTRCNEEKKEEEEKEDVQRGDDENSLESTRHNKDKKEEEEEEEEEEREDVQRGDDENRLESTRYNEEKKEEEEKEEEEEEEEEEEDVQRGAEEPETRGGSGGHSSQSAEAQDNQLSEGDQRIRRQEGLMEKTRDEDARGGRPESTSENRQQPHLRLTLSLSREPIREQRDQMKPPDECNTPAGGQDKVRSEWSPGKEGRTAERAAGEPKEEEEVKCAPQETEDVDGLSEKQGSASTETEQHSDKADQIVKTFQQKSESKSTCDITNWAPQTEEQTQSEITPKNNSEPPLKHTSMSLNSERNAQHAECDAPDDIQPQVQSEAFRSNEGKETDVFHPGREAGQQTPTQTVEGGACALRMNDIDCLSQSLNRLSLRDPAAAEAEQQVWDRAESTTEQGSSTGVNDRDFAEVPDSQIPRKKRKLKGHKVAEFGLSSPRKF